MHIQRLKLRDFRNLQDVEVFFFERDQSNGSCAFNTHAIIGQNGSGKSNLIEAIITIFRDLDLNGAASFDYELEYRIRGFDIRLAAKAGSKPKVWIDGKRESATRLADGANTYLPSHVFAYYSGKNERIEQLFQAHQDRFNKILNRRERTILTTSPDSDHLPASNDALVRRLFYCRGGHTQLVLLACLLSNDPAFKSLLDDLNILGLDSALFVLKQPHRLRKTLDEDDIRYGDNRFWYAQGTVVSEFLDKLWDHAVAPITHTAKKRIDFRGRSENQEQLYLFVPDESALRAFGDSVGPASTFFRYAEAAYIGDLIDEVRITVRCRGSDGDIQFNQLSEGELQLLTVLGLMRITSEDDCLFLLDEPDTHLNPIWKLRYFDEIERVINQDRGKTLAGDSQIIITTHDPMMVGGLRKQQVRILRRDNGRTRVSEPSEHPQGMGVTGLLRSEMFGLPSTLDRQTLTQLQRRNELLALKAKGGDLDPERQDELDRLKRYLEDLGFSREYRDPLYQLFIEKMYEVRSQPLDRLLSADELQEQEAMAREIIERLVKQERLDDLSSLARELAVKVRE